MHTENEKSRRVREMFGAIAGRYDFLNHFLSANVDRRWRQVCLKEVSKRIRIPAPRILDVGCGTADLSLCFSTLGRVVGCDFSQPMLRMGVQKVKGRSIPLLGADALSLPFRKECFDVVVSAFVLRNLADIDSGLGEMRRVLRPGGIVGILDFGMPRAPLFSTMYRWYFFRVLPKIGRLLSGVDGPYGYLPTSVEAFPPVELLKERVAKAGFVNIKSRLLTAGIAVLVIGESG